MKIGGNLSFAFEAEDYEEAGLVIDRLLGRVEQVIVPPTKEKLAAGEVHGVTGLSGFRHDRECGADSVHRYMRMDGPERGEDVPF